MQAENIMDDIKSKKDLNDPSLSNTTIDVRKSKGGTKTLPTYKNALIWMNIDVNLQRLFVYNEFASHLEVFKAPPWVDHNKAYPRRANDFDTLSLKTYLIETYSVEFAKSVLVEAVDNYGKTNSYDPVKQYLENLKWDGKPRLDTWLTTYLGVEPTLYSRAVGRLVLCAGCMRISRPGTKFDYMLILEGEQDLGKSLAIQKLGGEWSREVSLVDKTKDTVEKMQGAWLIEVSEMAVFNKKDIECLKAFITTGIDVERLPYGRRSMSFPRRNIFIGTINPSNHGYLSDNTGNRRFLPVECSAVTKNKEGKEIIDIMGIERDRDQLWAEAWSVHRKEKMYLDSTITALCRGEQGQREILDEWQDTIEKYVENKEIVTSVGVFTEGLHGFVTNFNRIAQIRVSDCLKKLGWRRQTVRVDSKLCKGFVRYRDPLNAEEETETQSEMPWNE